MKFLSITHNSKVQTIQPSEELRNVATDPRTVSNYKWTMEHSAASANNACRIACLEEMLYEMEQNVKRIEQ